MMKSVDTVLDLTKSGFKSIDSGEPRHFAAIGKLLITIGTEIDARLKTYLLQQISSGEETLPRAIIGDMRTGDVVAALRRIAEARPLKPEFYQDMNVLFAEISNLRRVRNIVAHRTCMISGNKLAFHNAGDARSDAAMEVNIYTLTELTQFTQYAKRIGYRIIRLFGTFTPSHLSPAHQAILTFAVHSLLAKTTSILVKQKSLTKAQLENFKSINHSSHELVNAYADAARKIDPNFGKLQQDVAAATGEFLSAILLVDAPAVPALHEIPPRLQTPPRITLKNKSRSHARTGQSPRK